MTRRISHLGLVVRDAEATARLWADAFGLAKFDQATFEVEGVRSVFLSAGGGRDEFAIELMEPLDKTDMNNAIARRLAEKGEGFYQLCLEFDDVAGAGKAVAARGFRVIDLPPVAAGEAPRWVVHPKDASGVMIEGIERRT